MLLATVILTLSAAAVTFITATLLPVVNNLVTKSSASNGVKVVVSVITAGIAAVIIEAKGGDGSAVISTGLLLHFIALYGWQLLMYLGPFKALGIPQKLAPAKGIG